MTNETKRPLCKGMRRTTQCGNYSRFDSDYCYWHNPEKRDNPKDTLLSAQRALMLEDALAAVRIIAEGRGDPVALCKSVLTRFNMRQPYKRLTRNIK